MCDLEKMGLMNLSAGKEWRCRHGGQAADTAGERRMNWESPEHTHTMQNRQLVGSCSITPGSSARCSGMPEAQKEWTGERRTETQKASDRRHLADSYCFAAKTITTLESNHPPITKKKKTSINRSNYNNSKQSFQVLRTYFYVLLLPPSSLCPLMSI